MTHPSDCISILQLTDTHIMASPEETLLGVSTAYYFNAVLESVLTSNRKFDLCLVTGDIAQDPCTASYEFILKNLQRLNIPCFCLPGNHDDLAIMQQVLATDSVNCLKHIYLGNWQIICLNSQVSNSANGYLSDDELGFLELCLKNNPDSYSLVAVHHHAIPCGSSWMDTMMIENAQDLFAILERYPKVKTLVTGHIHQATDSQLNSLRVLTTPSTCFQFKPFSEHFSLDGSSPGYRWINLLQDGAIDAGIIRIPEKIMGLQADDGGY